MHLERLINLLEIIAVVGRPVSVVEIQRASGLPRPTCYRLVQNLLDQGLIDEPNEDGRYIIGEKLVRIALLGTSDADVTRLSAPLMRAAVSTFNETVFLARFRNEKVEIIYVQTPNDPDRAYIHPGMGVRPLHACSCSKAIAAFAEDTFKEKILDGPLKAFTENTKTTREELLAEFEVIRSRGYADCDQEVDVGVSSVAAPVTVGSIGAAFSVGAVGPIRRFGADTRQSIGHQLTQLATRISSAIQLCNVAEAKGA